MKPTKKTATTPARTSIKQLDTSALAQVTGGGFSGPDTPGVMEPVNPRHLTEWELIQEC